MGSHSASPRLPAGEVRVALDAFRRIVQALRTSTRDTERRVGLSGAQLFALHQVAAHPGASVNELAARTFTHQSSVSVVVARLVERRLVAKLSSRDDRRRVRLAITDAGRTVLRRSPEPVQQKLIAGIRSLTVPRRRALAHALEAVAYSLTPTDGPAPMLFEDGNGASGRRGGVRPASRPRSASRTRR